MVVGDCVSLPERGDEFAKRRTETVGGSAFIDDRGGRTSCSNHSRCIYREEASTATATATAAAATAAAATNGAQGGVRPPAARRRDITTHLITPERPIKMLLLLLLLLLL